MGSVVGLDIGTMNLVSAKEVEKNKIELKSSRNMFFDVDTSTISLNEIQNTGVDYVVQKFDGIEKVYVIGEDSLKFSQIFGFDPKRPMNKGVISQGELDALDVITLIIEKLINKTTDGYCVYSIPAEPVDNDEVKVLYHEKVFSKILGNLGYKSKPLNEAMGIIFSNCSKERFSGIAMSWGCGMVNCAVSYRGVQAFSFSVSRGGDWIDTCVSNSTGTVVSRVTGIKEKKFSFNDPTKLAKNKKEKQILEALDFYYRDLIEYVLKIFVKQFEMSSMGLDIDEDIPIILSGGTSMPDGFEVAFKDVFNDFKNFPYSISEIRRASDPMTAVAQGNLIYALWDSKKDESDGKESKKRKEREEKKEE